MTSSSSSSKNIFADAEQALSDVSRLLSKHCKSRKSSMRLPEIIQLTGKVAGLARALKGQGTDHEDGYGDPDHHANISKDNGSRKNLIR